ncbi:MAG: hypothetical protein AAGI91_12910 [Bacteroidota bacterium]
MPTDFPPHRYVVLARRSDREDHNGDSLYGVHGGAETLDEAQREYLEAVAASGTTDVTLVERVPVLIHDGRSAQGRVIRLAERLAWCQTTMFGHGLSADDVASHVRFGAPAILRMFAGEEIRSDWVDQLVEAVRELTQGDEEGDDD